MREGWKEATLHEVLAPVVTKAGKNSKYEVLSVTEKRGIIPQSEVFNHRIATEDISKYKVLQPGDIAFNPYLLWCGAIGQWQGDYEGVVSPVYECFRAKESALPRYVGLIFESGVLTPYFDSTAIGSIVRRRRTTLPVFYEAEISLPPIEEQKRIVDVVSSVDAYIDSLQQQADSARIARDAVLTSLLEQIHPKSIVYPLKDIAVERGLIGGPFGSSLVTKDYQPSGVPVIRGKNLSSMSGLVEGPYVYVSEQKARELSRNLAVPGDLVVTQRGTLGQIAKVPFGEFESYVISQSQMRFRPNPELATNEFLYLQMSRKDFINEILSREVSTANPHINLGIFSELELKLPSIAEQTRIVEIVSSMDGVIQSTEKAVVDAKNLRSGLLSDLLSGEHEIPESYNRLLMVA
jgi:restriction endonuclease S subunit